MEQTVSGTSKHSGTGRHSGTEGQKTTQRHRGTYIQGEREKMQSQRDTQAQWNRYSGTVKHRRTDRQGKETDRQTGKMKEEHRTHRQMQALWGRQANRDRHSGTGRGIHSGTVKHRQTDRQARTGERN